MTEISSITGQRKLRMGMVGGGPEAFIGDVHRKAATMDGQIELVAGAFSRDPDKSRHQGEQLYLDPGRVYGSYQEMIEVESSLPDTQRIDLVSIVTPNVSHHAIAREFWQAGFHVVLDKPMTCTLDEALDLQEIIRDRPGQVFCLTHNYAGYPMVKLARDMVAAGDLGTLRKIRVEYNQGWLANPMERAGAKQAVWRTDPAQSGPAGCMADIGTHAMHLAEYITGLETVELCADLTHFVKGRALEDDGNCLVRWSDGVKGLLTASQISIGEENGLAIWIYGDKAGLEWHQERPDELAVKYPDGPTKIWRRGNDYVADKSPAAARATRLPFGHPEGYIETFANLYCNVAEVIRSKLADRECDKLALDFPGVDDGVRGIRFVDAVVASARAGGRWTPLQI